ncbi:MAG: phosphoribosylglycinamide formyltransferase [Marinagarivorans sp.]|nr:phosphoribosylglycinamide formyltransferase [Marinagarivorans sp.]
MRIVVLISGGGSNLQAIIDACASGQIDGSIAAVISNRPGVKGLARAAQHGLVTHTLDHKAFESRESFDAALMQLIDEHSPELIILAGFMRILTPAFTQHYLGRMMNIHPSLLPKYPGLHTHQRALEAGDSEHGVTVHFVTAELDGGPVVIQARVAVHADDTEATLAARVLEQEHRIYPQAAEWFCQGRLQLRNNQAWLDNRLIETK